MKTILQLSLFLFCLCLLGCAPIYKTHYIYTPPQSPKGKQCVSQCTQSRTMCKQLCQMNQENCELRGRDKARFEYESYVQQRQVNELPIERSLDSFLSTIHCQKTCSCGTQYRSCYSLCGGEVVANDRCVAFCK